MKYDSRDKKRREGMSEKRQSGRDSERVKMKCIIITELSDAVSNMMLNYRTILYSVNKNVEYR